MGARPAPLFGSFVPAFVPAEPVTVPGPLERHPADVAHYALSVQALDWT
jgi:hypothetical protein